MQVFLSKQIFANNFLSRYYHGNQTSVQQKSSALSLRSAYSADPSHPVLTIRNTEPADSGEYTCTVEYFLARTDYQVMDLVVIVLPEKTKVFLDSGQQVGDSIVVREGQYLSLNCASSGGSPPLEMFWWKDDLLVDDTFRK